VERTSASRTQLSNSTLLILTALLICVAGVGSFWLADIYHANPVWVFLAWNCIGILAFFVEDFGAQIKKPSFVAFLVVWALLHGGTVALLMRWISLPMMLPFFFIEGVAGYLLANIIFDIRPGKKEKS